MPITFDPEAMRAAVRREVMLGVMQATERVRAEAVRLVLKTAKTGKLYGEHRASAPGEPWASNTGFTVSQIKVHYETGDELTGRVSIDAEWGPYLELGTQKMAARPVLRPAIANTADDVQRIMQDAVNRAMRRLGGGG